MKTFGEELVHFAQSADFLTMDHVDALKRIIFKYLKKRIGAAVVEVCTERIFDMEIALEYAWFSENKIPSIHHIFDRERKYYGQTSYAFHRNIKLWIVSEDDTPLAMAASYTNLWGSSYADIPRFIPYSGNENIKTSIILPLTISGKPRGVLNLEFERRLEFSESIRDELIQIKEALEILIDLVASSQQNQTNTTTAIERLKTLADVHSHRYFISYCWDDADAADHIEALLRRKFRVVHRDEAQIGAGTNLSDGIKRLIKASDTFVAIWSAQSSKSDWVPQELDFALGRQRKGLTPTRVVLITLDEADPPMLLTGNLRLMGNTRKERNQALGTVIDSEET